MGQKMSSEEDDSSDEEPAKKNVYKAPKLNAVAYEDPKDKKAR
jgi:U3 small nucleolar RNA-associated protein 3